MGRKEAVEEEWNSQARGGKGGKTGGGKNLKGRVS